MEFWDPLNISETAEARNFKFGKQIDHEGHYDKNVRGYEGGHVTLLALEHGTGEVERDDTHRRLKM